MKKYIILILLVFLETSVYADESINNGEIGQQNNRSEIEGHLGSHLKY